MHYILQTFLQNKYKDIGKITFEELCTWSLWPNYFILFRGKPSTSKSTELRITIMCIVRVSTQTEHTCMVGFIDVSIDTTHIQLEPRGREAPKGESSEHVGDRKLVRKTV